MMLAALDRIRSWRIPWLSVLALPFCLLLWQSFFWATRVPAPVKIAYAALTLLAALRPRDALLIVAAFATLSAPLTWLVETPVDRAPGILVLAFLVGWLGRNLASREPGLDHRDTLRAPTVVFAVTVFASLIVVSAAVQSAVAPPWQFVRDAFQLLARDYFAGVHFETHNWYQAALLIEGCLLFVAVLQLTRDRVEFRLAIARMLAAGVVAAALLSCVRVGLGLVRSLDPANLLVEAITTERISAHIADFNAAGSHFVLILPVIWALATMVGANRAARWQRYGWGIAAIPVVAALWLTGSRAAQFSIALTTAIAVALAMGWRHTIKLALLALAVLAVIAVVIVSRPAPESSVLGTLNIRWLFAQTSWEMFRSAPIFGIGIAEYYGRSAALMPEALKQLYAGGENAHNNFFQIGVELGLVGLGGFLWMLIAAARRIRPVLGRARRDPLLASLAVGLATALLTFLTGHPLLVGAFAFGFWIAFALAVSQADGLAAPGKTTPGVISAKITPGVVFAVAIISIIVLVPFRAHMAREGVDLSNVRFGFGHDATDEETNAGFVWAGPHATFFASSAAHSVLLSVGNESHSGPIALEVRVEGVLASAIVLRDGVWRDLKLMLPANGKTGHAFRRIDLSARSAAPTSPASSSSENGGEARIRVRTIEVK